MATAVKYIDIYGNTQTVTDYKVVTSSDTTWTAGFYVVESDTTINQSITVSGDVKLIVKDGVSLTVNASTTTKAGIAVTNDNPAAATNYFTVFGGNSGEGEIAGTGVLTVTGGTNAAGIGGGYNQSGSHITIAGGVIKATGGTQAAGIGGGKYRSGEYITITGGDVTASGSNAAGIGGGYMGSASNITISGGTVTATATDYGAGVGSGYQANASYITISGGTVIARAAHGAGIGGGGYGTGSNITISGGAVDANASNYGAGVGSGRNANASDITISGGTVIARGYNGAGIGGGYNGAVVGGSESGVGIAISGGEVIASSSQKGAGIGGGENGAASNIAISGGVVGGTGSYGAGIGGGSNANASNIKITGGVVGGTSTNYGAGIGGGYKGTLSGGTITGGVVTAYSRCGAGIGIGQNATTAATDISVNTELELKAGASAAAATDVEHSTGTDIAAKLNKTYVLAKAVAVSYVDENGISRTLQCGNYTLIGADSSEAVTWGTTGETTYYVVGADYNDDGVINAADAAVAGKKIAFTITGGATVSGNVKLIVADGFSLTVTGSEGAAGVTVSNDGLETAANFFTVYGQKNGAGVLSATGGAGAAGIGGGLGASGSQITLAGGTVVAAGAEGGAGIGGGRTNNAGTAGNGTDIKVTGGTVIATGNGGAGIGGGYRNGDFSGGAGSNIKISDGVVVATGSAASITDDNHSGAGIGGGYGDYADASDITISGGKVIATSTERGAGIGGGGYGVGSNIRISGGDVTATSTDGAGIGCGFKGGNVSKLTGSKITITGGTLTASSTNGDAMGKGSGQTNDYSGIYVNTGMQLVADETEISHTTGTDIAGSLEGKESVSAQPGVAVGYVDEKGNAQTLQYGNYTLIDADSAEAVTWEAGWYVVGADYNDDGVINAEDAAVAGKKTAFEITGGATVSGDVKLIVADGFTLTVNASGVAGKAGINVTGSTNQFTVYGQTASTGSLTVTGGTQGAGIGGGKSQSAANITIAGGVVTATGSDAAGIGGGYNAGASNITIYGGDVTATGTKYGAGIGGGGFQANASDIAIYGGKVTANATDGAGIGGGGYGTGSNITISGGTVDATANYGAGIGGGRFGSASDIMISGGMVGGTSSYGAGIGGGYNGAVTGGSKSGVGIAISGGVVTGTSKERGAGIGSGQSAAASAITISGGTVTGIGSWGAGIGGGEGASGDASNIKITGGMVGGTSTNYGAGIGGGNHGDFTGGTITGGVVTAYSRCGDGIGTGQATDATVSNIYVTDVNWVVKVGTSSPSSTITHGSEEDIHSKLADKNYALSRFETVTVSSGTTGTAANQTYSAVSGNAFSVSAGSVLNLADGVTFSGNTTAIANAGTVNVLGAVALDGANDTITGTGAINWDLTAGSTSKLDFAISDWSKVTATGAKTVTIDGASQYKGNYALANNVTGDFEVTLKGLDQDYTLSLAQSQTIGTTYYGLSKTAGTVSLLIAEEATVGGTATTYCAGEATRITGGSTAKMFFGGAKNPTAETGSCTVSIVDGAFAQSVAAGDAASKQAVSQTGDLTLSIENGEFTKRVAGGMYAADTDAATSTELTGNVSLTIKGGTFNGRIYGGSNAQTDAVGCHTTIEGSVSVTVDSSVNAIAINEYLIGGSRGNSGTGSSGKITGSVTVTFTGLGSNLTFASTSVVAGGCSGDYARINSDGARSVKSSVAGDRNLVFDAFTGNFGAEIRLFSTVTFENKSNVAFANANVDLWAIETWNFEFGSSFSNLLANDFTGDRLNFDVTGLTTGTSWTAGAGSVSAFDELNLAGSVYFGDSKASYDSANACWTDNTYKLALNDDKNAMIVSKIA